MRKHFTFFILLIFFSTIRVLAQDSTTINPPPHIAYSGYVDAYYAAYSDSAGRSNYEKYTTISPRSNQFGLNVAMFTAKYTSKDVRGTFTLHYGDIPRSSWSSTYNYIQEANAGIRLSKTLWLDAGFFRTHLGTEALFPKENYTSSVSVPTYFEPYYESGFRLDYEPTDRLSLFVYVINGYGIYEDNNSKKSAGVLFTYLFSTKFNVGYSGYYGDDTPDSISASHFRTMHNVFLNYKGKKFKVTAGGDFVMQQNSGIAHPEKTAMMGSGVLILSYNTSKKYRIYTRGEVFEDPYGIFSGIFADQKNYLTGLKIWGATFGIEYKPADNSYIRLEGRDLIADDAQKIFYSDNKYTNTRFEVMINLGVSFE